jgi:capsular polysaccharide export protein
MREDLTQQGTEVWKVNLNGGDDLYYYGERCSTLRSRW